MSSMSPGLRLVGDIKANFRKGLKLAKYILLSFLSVFLSYRNCSTIRNQYIHSGISSVGLMPNPPSQSPIPSIAQVCLARHRKWKPLKVLTSSPIKRAAQTDRATDRQTHRETQSRRDTKCNFSNVKSYILLGRIFNLFFFSAGGRTLV